MRITMQFPFFVFDEHLYFWSFFLSLSRKCQNVSCFFFNDTATTEIYPLSLHDALPISRPGPGQRRNSPGPVLARHGPPLAAGGVFPAEHLGKCKGRSGFPWQRKLSVQFFLHGAATSMISKRSEEHTSELQSPDHFVSRL